MWKPSQTSVQTNSVDQLSPTTTVHQSSPIRRTIRRVPRIPWGSCYLTEFHIVTVLKRENYDTIGLYSELSSLSFSLVSLLNGSDDTRYTL